MAEVNEVPSEEFVAMLDRMGLSEEEYNAMEDPEEFGFPADPNPEAEGFVL